MSSDEEGLDFGTPPPVAEINSNRMDDDDDDDRDISRSRSVSREKEYNSNSKRTRRTSHSRSNSRDRGDYKTRSHSRSRSPEQKREREQKKQGSPIDYRRRRSRSPASSSALPRMYSVVVRELPMLTREEELKRKFAKFGKIGDVFMPFQNRKDIRHFNSHGFTYGFVRFMTEDERQDCVKYCERNRIEFDGRRVKVGMAHNEPGPEIIARNAERREAEKRGRRSRSPMNYQRNNRDNDYIRPNRREFSPPSRRGDFDARNRLDDRRGYNNNNSNNDRPRIVDSRDSRDRPREPTGLTRVVDNRDNYRPNIRDDRNDNRNNDYRRGNNDNYRNDDNDYRRSNNNNNNRNNDDRNRDNNYNRNNNSSNDYQRRSNSFDRNRGNNDYNRDNNNRNFRDNRDFRDNRENNNYRRENNNNRGGNTTYGRDRY